jgi:NhaA family Na+:H+ antiporter
MQRRRVGNLWLYVPLWVLAWVLMHESGVHATIAGVAVGLATRATPDRGEKETPAERYEHLIRPISAGFAVPLFALLAAGVTINAETLTQVVTQPVGIGILTGLVVGKVIGITLGTFLAVRYTRATLARGLGWADVVGVGSLAGIGFTVSLLIASLAFETDPELEALAKTAVLVASLVAATLASVLLLPRNARYTRLRAERPHGLREDVDDEVTAAPGRAAARLDQQQQPGGPS